MPKGQVKKTNLTRTPSQIILLLVQFILIKIGDLPLWIIHQMYDKLSAIAIYLSHFRLPRFEFPRYHLQSPTFYTLAFDRRRGRPRKTWFLPFYLNKFRLYFKRRISKRTKIGLAVLFFAMLIFFYTSFILNAAYQLPSPDRLISPNQPLTTEFYDRHGKLLYRLYEGRNRTLITLDELPKHLIWATIATEDKNFYQHSGFEPLAIVRAFYQNLTQGSQQGASTITQQLVKNSLLTPEKTYIRKIKEIILALWAETIYSKGEILQMYFNEAPYGGPAWGIEAASQTYFGKSASNLSLAESAFLAGLPASPTQFSPYGTNPELSKSRQTYVLTRMEEEGYITKEQKESYLNETLALKPLKNDILAPHFVFYVKDLLSQKFGPRVVSQGGLKITTTLDLELQQEAENFVKQELDSLSPLNVKNGAAMVTDAKTGQILAMIGSRDYHYPGFGNFNVALSLRQPGSSIKVITYATAFKEGFSPGNTILDTPVSFKDGARAYSPQNYDNTFHGPVSIRTALGSSFNVPAVKMLASIGVDNMIQTATDLGISTFNDPKRFGLSLTLGAAEVKMIDMMAVYGTLSQLGRFNRPTPILSVTDSSGNILEEYQDLGKQTLKEEIAYLISSILSDNKARTAAFGANSQLNIAGQVVASKTGTSDNKRDNWTFGYTQNFVVGVWVGNNDNSPMNPDLTSGVTGAAPIWRKITQLMLQRNPSLAFSKPDGLVEITVDGRRDLAIAGSLPKSLVRVRKDADKLIFSDAFSTYATPSAQAAIKNETAN